MKNRKRKFSVLHRLPEAKNINKYTDPLRKIETKNCGARRINLNQ